MLCSSVYMKSPEKGKSTVTDSTLPHTLPVPARWSQPGRTPACHVHSKQKNTLGLWSARERKVWKTELLSPSEVATGQDLTEPAADDQGRWTPESSTSSVRWESYPVWGRGHAILTANRMTLEGDRRNESSATSPWGSQREGKGQLGAVSSAPVPREPPLRHLMKEVSGRHERGAYPRSRVTGVQQVPGEATLPSSVRTLNSTFLIHLFGGGGFTWLFCF